MLVAESIYGTGTDALSMRRCMIIVCNNCGKENNDSACFCVNCGAPLRLNKQKHRKIKVVCILLFCLVGIAISVLAIYRWAAPTDEMKIRQKISQLENCYNKADTDGLIQCFDENVQNTYRAVTGIGSELFGVDPSQILNAILGFGADLTGYDNLHIDVKSIKITEPDRAEVELKLRFDNNSKDISLVFTKAKSEWHISGTN